MTITVMTRYKVSNAVTMTTTATEAKRLVIKHGAEPDADMSHIHTGVYAGEWLFVARYANWIVFGNAQEALASDPDWAKMLKLAATVSELTGRNITDSIHI
jgi:hypothetical protein